LLRLSFPPSQLDFFATEVDMATEDGSDGDDAMAASSAPSDSAKMKVMVAQVF
jgi:hypothetical protein